MTVALSLVLFSIPILILGGTLSAILYRHDRAARITGCVAGFLGTAVGLSGALLGLIDGVEETVASVWRLPVGTVSVGLDPLTSFFLFCIFLVCGLGVVYAIGYLKHLPGRARVAPALAFFNLLVVSMAVVVLARDAILFLLAWEAMSLSSFFLVTFDASQESTRRAGIFYLIACHVGLVPLVLLFVLLGDPAGSFGFQAIRAATAPGGGLATAAFLLALLGFGIKAGFWPVHVWLPEAHPAAPSHVSAVMSGVMIKLGIYGLLRTLTLLGTPLEWWGFVLIAIGIVSGVGGVLHALAQHDLKRLLAYSSIENIGIIALGMGLGIVGRANGNSTIAFLGFGGALLHVLNHGLFKGLLFQGAGSVMHATGTRDLDSLGGLMKRMPVTGAAFLTGSAAISGLPPLNGFVGELLIYVGAFLGVVELPSASGLWTLAIVPALALIGGLAAACFVKAFGVVFLGEPRTPAAAAAHEVDMSMRIAMVAGAALCIAIGVAPQVALRLIEGPGALLAGSALLPPVVTEVLSAVTRASLALICLVALAASVRFLLLRRREVRRAATWGCGYEAPTPRMQYTSASFADQVLAPAETIFEHHIEAGGLNGYFPRTAHHHERLGDMAADRVMEPAMGLLVSAFGRLGFLQQGGVSRYLVWVLLTVVVLLVWQLGAF